MITDKVVKGAGSHRILAALSERPRTSKELKKVVGAINSLRRFDDEYMARLQSNGYVTYCVNEWSITVKGMQKCSELGELERPNRAMPKMHRFEVVMVERPPVLRHDALDFMRCPSRRGNFLYYRDGRVEKAE